MIRPSIKKIVDFRNDDPRRARLPASVPGVSVCDLLVGLVAAPPAEMTGRQVACKPRCPPRWRAPHGTPCATPHTGAGRGESTRTTSRDRGGIARRTRAAAIDRVQSLAWSSPRPRGTGSLSGSRRFTSRAVSRLRGASLRPVQASPLCAACCAQTSAPSRSGTRPD